MLPSAVPTVETTPTLVGRSSANLTLLGVFVVVVLGAAVVGRDYYLAQRATILAETRSDLSAIRDLKVAQIVQWRASLLADGRMIVDDPLARNEMRAWLDRPEDVQAAALLRSWLDDLCRKRGYEGAVLLVPGTSRWVTTTDGSPPDMRDADFASAVLESAETTLTEMFANANTGRPQIDVVAPVRSGSTAPVAAVVLHRDPRGFLFPLIQRWPTPSLSGETLLVRRDGGEILFLNDLRFMKDAALRLRIPITRQALPAARAVSGGRGVAEGLDYRGKPVLAAVGPVRGSDWFIVAKVDSSEAYATLFASERTTLAGIGLIVLAAGMGLALAWRQRSAALYKQNLDVEREARLLAERYGQLARYANDAILGAGQDLRITQANDRAAALYGYSLDELIGMSIEDLRAPGAGDEVAAALAAVLPGQGVVLETVHRRKDGSLFPVEVSIRGLEHDGGAMYLEIIRDITERRAAEEALKERTDELVRSNSDLERFAYVASHDLQEPLRMVASFVQLLQRRYSGKLDADADEFIGFAVDGALRMQSLINDLLSYSRVGTNTAPFVPADLEDVLAGVLRGLEPAIREARAVVTHERLPTVTCDPTQIGQVFQNLIGNAVKFRREEPPRVHVSCRRAGGAWEFCVTDNGIGMDPAYFDRVFVIFQRLHPHSDYQGTGMGLAICKRIVERHGGRIWVESAEGRGSKFCFTLRDSEEG